MIPDTQTARSILIRLAEISIYALIIFLCILSFRAVFRKKAGPVLRYGMWFLLLLRLTLPVTIASSVHLIVLPEQNPEPLETPAAAVASVAAVPTEPAARPQTGRRLQQAEGGGGESPEGGKVRPSLTVWQILFLVWIVGAAGILARDLWTAALLQARLKHYASVPCAEIRKEFRALLDRMGLSESICLLLVQDIASPALTIGVLPKVLLPESLSWPEQKRDRMLALRHELTHLKRRDHLVMIWFGILRIVWWFLPMVWLMEKPLRMDMESACDAMVVAGMTNEEKLYYASLLLDLGKENNL